MQPHRRNSGAPERTLSGRQGKELPNPGRKPREKNPLPDRSDGKPRRKFPGSRKKKRIPLPRRERRRKNDGEKENPPREKKPRQPRFLPLKRHLLLLKNPGSRNRKSVRVKDRKKRNRTAGEGAPRKETGKHHHSRARIQKPVHLRRCRAPWSFLKG